MWFVYTVTRLEEHNFDTTAVCSIGMHATGRPGGVVINLEYYLGVGSFDSPYSYGVFISRKTPAAERARDIVGKHISTRVDEGRK